MEYIILCMLLLKKMTIYEMRTYIQRNLSTVCSDSLGSMQTTIKKLLDRGYIDVSESVENNTLKRQYSITVKGVVYFKERIGTPMNIQKMKNMEAGKFFFLGMASKEKRIAFVRDYIENLAQTKNGVVTDIITLPKLPVISEWIVLPLWHGPMLMPVMI